MPKRGPHGNFRRRPSRRSPKARVLVVCEGERTEPLYFEVVRDRLRLNTLVVKAAKGVDPRNLVNMASEEVRKERRNGSSSTSCTASSTATRIHSSMKLPRRRWIADSSSPDRRAQSVDNPPAKGGQCATLERLRVRLAMLKAACAIGAILFVVLAIDAIGGPGAGFVAALVIGFVIGALSSAD